MLTPPSPQLLLPLLTTPRPQVGYDIYSEEDLLALDSSPGAGAVAVAPPPGFLAQLALESEDTGVALLPQNTGVALMPTPQNTRVALLPTPLPPVRAPVQGVGPAMGASTTQYTSTRGGDGSYNFG